MVCETFTGGTFIVSDFCGIFCKRLLHAGNETGRSRGKTDDEREEFPGECNIGLVEFDDGGEDDPFDDVDESSALEILWLPELDMEVAWVVTLVFVKFEGVV